MATKTGSTIESVKLFALQNILLEADLASLEATGIDLGHAKTLKKDSIVDTELFERDIREQAERMAELYVLYYCLENTIRRLISGRLREKHGANWWDAKVPQDIRNNVKEKQEKERDTVFAIRSDDVLCYTNFGELIVIINSNWADFADTLRSRKPMEQTLSLLNQLRNVIAHSCELSNDDIVRFETCVKDWLRIQT